MMEEKVVLAHLFHNYTVESTLDVGAINATVLKVQYYDRRMRLLPETISRTRHGFPVKLYKRFVD